MNTTEAFTQLLPVTTPATRNKASSCEAIARAVAAEDCARYANRILPGFGQLDKLTFLSEIPNHILARMCEMRGITGVTDREGMITRLSQS